MRVFHTCNRSIDSLRRHRSSPTGLGFWAMLPDFKKWSPYAHEWIKSLETPLLMTEELAELHAIVQAIEYERGSTPEAHNSRNLLVASAFVARGCVGSRVEVAGGVSRCARTNRRRGSERGCIGHRDIMPSA